jgi:peptide/nickel transport system substrate-binding protein
VWAATCANNPEEKEFQVEQRTQQRSGPLHELFVALREGRISRRSFIARATALGMASGAALACANTVSAQVATPSASPESSRPASGTDTQTRGEGGDLRMLQWQAISQLSPHTTASIKDALGATLVLEPLMHFAPDGTLLPNLVQSVPSVAADSLAADYSSVIFNLLPDVTWSDGEPFTANDLRFTWQWIIDEANGSVSAGYYAGIADIVVVDDLTAEVTFVGPQPTWYQPFTGVEIGAIYPAHVFEADPDAITAFSTNPIGTGPFVVESLTPDDQVIFLANENYREPTKPYFSRVIIKGGGDAASAARAVFQTGEYDFAWNLAVEPEVLLDIAKGENGKLIVTHTTNTERLHFNFSDPDTEVDGQKAEVNTPHKFLSDPVVRQAISLAVDRETIANQLYLGGADEPATADVLAGIPALQSRNNPVVFDPEQAITLLDEAGWVLDGDWRAKDGVQLRARYVSAVNSVRQKIQAVVKENLEDIGIEVILEQVDPNIFFDITPGNDQSITKFYSDFLQLSSGAESPHPSGFMIQWYAGEDNSNIPQANNDWLANNFQRYVNPEYDALLDAVTAEPDPLKAAEMFIELNDIVVADNAVISMVNLSDKNGVATWLNEENLAPGPFSNAYWNIANWNRIEE